MKAIRNQMSWAFVLALGFVALTFAASLSSAQPSMSPSSFGPWQQGPDLPKSLYNHGMFAAKGYVFVVGGDAWNGIVSNELGRVYSAPLLPDGSTGGWTLTGHLPALSSPAKVASDGENAYLLGDDGRTWWYAIVETGGTFGSWQATASISGYGPPNYGRCGVAIYAGRVFYAELHNAFGEVIVHTASIQSDGSLGPWSTAATIAATIASAYDCPELAAQSGFLYLLTSDWRASVTGASWAAIQEDGTLGTIIGVAQTNYYRERARMVGAAGYLYAIGGWDPGKGQSGISVERAPIDPQSGALGSWQVVDASLPDRFFLGGAAVYDRRLYLAGGYSAISGYYNGVKAYFGTSVVAPLDDLAQPLPAPVPTFGPTPTPTPISRIQAPPLETARNDWVPMGLTGKSVVQAVPDPSVAGRIYARASDGSYRSDDSGASWQSITDTLPFLARDPNDPNVAYETNHIQYGEDAFLRSADGGLTWSGVFTTTQSGYSVFYLGRISAVPPPPSGGSVPSLLSIYTAYGGYHVEGDGRRTYWSQDEGEFWQSADTPNLGWVSLAVSPVLPTTWAAVANSYQPPYFFDIPNPPRVPPALYRSQDAGATWTEISLSPVISNPVALAADPVQADRFYLVSSDKVFLLDGVQRWVDMTGSLPSVTINSLALDYASPPNLLLGTTNGVWVRKLTYATSQGLFFPVGPGDPSLSSASIALFPSSGVSSTISWTASISPTVSWLSVVPASGSSLPVTVTVSADASGLTQSHYSSSIAFRVSGAAPSQDIETPVELYVGPVSRSYLPVVPEGIAAW